MWKRWRSGKSPRSRNGRSLVNPRTPSRPYPKVRYPLDCTIIRLCHDLSGTLKNSPYFKISCFMIILPGYISYFLEYPDLPKLSYHGTVPYRGYTLSQDDDDTILALEMRGWLISLLFLFCIQKPNHWSPHISLPVYKNSTLMSDSSHVMAHYAVYILPTILTFYR